MRRPRSAKPGARLHNNNQEYYEEDSEEQNFDKQKIKTQFNPKEKHRLYSANHHKKLFNIIKPIEVSNGEFTRIMPKNILHDKQRLYSQALKLKQNMHGVVNQNIKLKTKLAIIEKQKEKISRFYESDYASKSKLNSTNTFNANQAGMVPGLKKIIREYKNEIDQLRIEYNKVKKTVKYTKIRELEIQTKNLHDQNTRLNTLLAAFIQKENQEADYQRQIEELESYLKVKLQENDKLMADNSKLLNHVEGLEDSLSNYQQKTLEKEKKLNKDLQINKRKLNQYQKQTEYLKSELAKVREEKLKLQASKGTFSNRQKVAMNNINNKNKNKQSNNQGLLDQIQKLKKRNNDLEKKISQLTLIKSTNQVEIVKSIVNKQNLEQKKEQKKHAQKLHQQVKQKQALLNQPLEHIQLKTDKKQTQDVYQQQFEKQEIVNNNNEKKDNINKVNQKQQYQIPISNNVQNNSHQQILYQKQNHQKEKKKKNTHNKKNLQLQHIQELLTYRLIAQRYPFQELKQDIYDSGESSFKMQQLQSMLMNSPFFFNEKQTQTILLYFFDTKKLDIKMTLSIDDFVDKLRNLIKEFQLVDQKQQEEMYIRISQMVTAYAAELQAAFQQKKNGEDSISKSSLQELFKQLQLSQPYIDLIISQLAMVSQDLEHLSYLQFFKRFYIDEDDQVKQVDQQYEHSNERTLNRNMIEEQQLQDSEQDKRSKKKNENDERKKMKKIKDQFSDNRQQY